MKIHFIIKYDTEFGEYLSLCINGESLPMQWSGGGLWKTSVDLKPGEYNYSYELCRDSVCIRKENTLHFSLKLKKGDDDMVKWDYWFDRDSSYYTEVQSVFKRQLVPYGSRAAGVAVPVFSLRSATSFGVGEFRDLKLLVDLMAECSMSIVQVLPINDTTRDFSKGDSYPYSACSSFALHPQFINLESVPGFVADKDYKARKKELNSLQSEDYEKVNTLKDKYLRKLFELNGGEKVLEDGEMKKFLKDNSSWLTAYACFRALTAQYGTADFSRWEDMAVYSDKKAKEYARAHGGDVAFYMWVQYQLDRQLSEVVEYGASRKVYFKGDLPIGVGRHSADAWQHPGLFNMDSCAGAPPDFFSKDGQNWGFPTYNWDAMAQDGYSWWRARLGKMAKYFRAYRIDHILGFFRIWEIPYKVNGASGVGVSGLYGHFNPSLPYTEDEIRYFDPDNAPGEHPLFLEYPRGNGGWVPKIGAYDLPEFDKLNDEKKNAFRFLYVDFFHHRHNDFWRGIADGRLSGVITGLPMLACGEDLGMIPDCVPGVMDKMHILSLEIPRMPKDPGLDFERPADCPYLSVCTSGTHDMSTMRLWWKQSPEMAGKFYGSVLGKTGACPKDPSAELCLEVFRNVMFSPSMMCIVPLQDIMACSDKSRLPFSELESEQINNPADPHHYWRYRMNVSIEDLLADKALCADVKKAVTDSARTVRF